jgi:hypothetical protein
VIPLPDPEVSAELNNSGKAEQHCQALLNKAPDAGGKDNITVVVAHYSLPPTAPRVRS